MKRVHSSESLAEIGHLRNLLEQSGIPCAVKNDQLCGALGEIPFLECMPELWVLRDGDTPEALQVIEQFGAAAASAVPWKCHTCGETNEGQFAACWQCARADGRP
jgi:hypothetical protein